MAANEWKLAMKARARTNLKVRETMPEAAQAAVVRQTGSSTSIDSLKL
jgi:hypothetical protein